MTEAAMQADGGRIAFSGALVARGIGGLWPDAIAAARQARDKTLTIDLAEISALDTTGAAMLLAMEASHGGAARIDGASERADALLRQMRDTAQPVPSKADTRAAAAEAEASGRGPGFNRTLATRIAFFGDTVIAVAALPAKMRFLRDADFARVTDRAGLQALPLVLMLGFLIGMILAFQSAIPMQQFGADLYVANLVALSLFRELGPLLVAVILSGRTGSAFAAELGTMKVNEEIAALTTMGIDPETMLVLPRMAATMLVMPALVVAMDIAGLLGMGVVLMVFGYPPTAIAAQVVLTTKVSDFLLGLFKGEVFAAAVALIGCRAGLTAGNGPQAVGEAATSAVVGGIVATVLLDGLFAVVFYRLGL